MLVAGAYLVFGHILMPVRGVGISMTPTIDPDRMTAQVCLTAQARYGDGTGARELEARELDITLRKQEGDRVVSSVTLVRTLEPLTPR